eukprot:2713030-Heterocapsa_arctica.AAC.1
MSAIRHQLNKYTEIMQQSFQSAAESASNHGKLIRVLLQRRCFKFGERAIRGRESLLCLRRSGRSKVCPCPCA